MKLMRKVCSFLVIILYSTTIKAQNWVNLAVGDTAKQNFDTVAKTSVAKLPTGWRVGISTIPFTFSSTTQTTTTQTGGISISSNALGGIYNFAAGDTVTATDRAIGGLSDGSAVKSVNLYVDLFNYGATPIGGYIISYDVEKYRNGSNPAGFAVNLGYFTDSLATWNLGPDFTLFFPADVDNKGYTSPVPGLTRHIISKKLDAFVAPNAHCYLAWNYSVNSGNTTTNAQALGIDNVTIVAIPYVSPPSLIAGALNGFGNVCTGTASVPNSFTLTGSNLNGSAIVVGPLVGYRFSTSAVGPFFGTTSPPYIGTSLNATIYVQFTPTSVRSYSGSIPVSGGGVTLVNVAATGSGVNSAPTVSTGNASSITSSGATLAGSIIDSGCSSISTYGIEYSTVNGFANGAGTIVSGSGLNNGNFISPVSGLSSGTAYYYHSFAGNRGDTSYGAQQSFTTNITASLPLNVVATAATDTTSTSFTANWKPAPGAVSYRLDVATTKDFIDDTSPTTVAKWSFPVSSADSLVDTANSANAGKIITATGTNSLTFDVAGYATKAARATNWANGSGAKYWQIEVNTIGQQNLLLSSRQRSSSTGPKDFKVQYRVGSSGTWTDISSPSVTVADDFTTGVVIDKVLPDVCSNQPSVFIRWIMTSNTSVNNGSVGSTGASLIDDILITGSHATYVPGYKDTVVSDTSLAVTGLSPNTTYYYRVRAVDGDTISPNSNIITVTTSTDTTAAPLPLEVVATPATDTTSTSFTANWKPTLGAVSYRLDVATTDDFSGTFVAGYEDILVNDTLQSVTGLAANTTYYYRVRAFDGDAMSPNSNTITVTTLPDSVLPTVLLSFSGVGQNNKNLLQWTTAIENNNRGFDLQRSTDSVHYQSISFVPSAAPGGKSTQQLDYTFNDYDITSDKQFYRLSQVDLDGKNNLSDTILIWNNKIDTPGIANLYPNPATGKINVMISAPAQERITCSITDFAGHKVKQVVQDLNAGSNVFSIDITGLPTGVYYLKCMGTSGAAFNRKFIIR